MSSDGDGAPRAFSCPVDVRDDEVVVAPSGELDMASVPTFEAAADDAVAAGRERLVVDLGGLTFIDSSGMRALMRLHARAGQMELVPGPRPVQRVFELAGLTAALPFRR